MMTVTPVQFEYRTDALGIGAARPRLSWYMFADDSSQCQTAYELERDGSIVRVNSAEQILVPWPFSPLASRARATVRVRVLSSGRRWTDWSEPSGAEIGLLSQADWVARFVSPHSIGRIGESAPVVSRTVVLREDIVCGRLYATAYGTYEAVINGDRVGDEIIAPGWTSYSHRLCYQTHDVTDLLREGENRLDVLLGNGWYRGRLGWTGARACYGNRLALLAQLEVTYADGSVDVVGTDEKWFARESGVVENDLYDGQRTDLRFESSAVDAVDVLDEDLSRLVAPEGPPLRVTDVLPSMKVWQSPSGKTLVDFAQNVVGWVRLKVRDATAGQEIIVRHAEVLEHGELGVRPLRSAKATDSYILDDTAEVVLEPSLTFHGFRYAEVAGAQVLAEDVEAVVIGSDLRRTGWFNCSDPLLNQFHENVVWGMRGNFVDVPTDCPQRDERMGWTGDAQIFSPTACFLFDTAGFFSSWLADLGADQRDDGSVPYVIPEVPGLMRDGRGPSPTSAAWGDAATIVPWVLYQRYGDRQILERQYDSMRRWIDKVASLTSDGVWAGGFQYGDWLDPDSPPNNPFGAKADPDVVATAYLARSAEIVARAAEVVGRDGTYYANLADRTRQAFARHYVTQTGRIVSDAPTVYALAIEWALLPTPEQRESAGRRLTDVVRANGFRISTGFVGTPLITDALTTIGRTDLAYRLLLQTECPSWLYPVTMGATTIWERWDSMFADGSINPGEMTSFNHYAFGAVADWLHRTVAGLAPAEPGYRRLTIRPIPYSTLTYASARHLTPYGEASVAWRRENGRFTLDVVVPVGSEATVHLPDADPLDLGHGHHTWTVADPCGRANQTISTVRDLIDNPRLWNEAVTLLVDYGIGTDATDLAKQAAPYLDLSPAELPHYLVLDDSSGIADDASQAVAKLLG